MDHQLSFSDAFYTCKKKTTRKERFLREMDAVLPWDVLLQPILRHYPKPGLGRRPIPASVMLRIYFLQQWYGLSDPGMEDSLYGVESMRRFAGVGLDAIPDETTICKFRHFLQRHGLTEVLFERTGQYLSERGLIVHEGTMVDATIVAAATSTKNRAQARDPQMGSTKKGTTWHFGLKAHVGSDLQGRVHTVVVTSASVHDSQMMDECLHGDEQVLYGDKAYGDAQRQQDAQAEGVEWRVLRKAQRGKKLNCADHSFNRKSNRTRARVEHPFGIIKHLWGYRKVRYRGLAKNAAQLFTLFALANVYLTRKELIAT